MKLPLVIEHTICRFKVKKLNFKFLKSRKINLLTRSLYMMLGFFELSRFKNECAEPRRAPHLLYSRIKNPGSYLKLIIAKPDKQTKEISFL